MMPVSGSLPAQVGVGGLYHPGGVAGQGAAREKDPGRLAGGRVRPAQGEGRGGAPLDVVLDALMGGQRPLAPGHQGFPGCQADPAGVEVLGADRLAQAAVMAGVGDQGVGLAPFPEEADQLFFRVGKLLHIMLEKGAVLDALGAGAGEAAGGFGPGRGGGEPQFHFGVRLGRPGRQAEVGHGLAGGDRSTLGVHDEVGGRGW